MVGLFLLCKDATYYYHPLQQKHPQMNDLHSENDH